MFFIKHPGVLSQTTLQLGDRIRVRPKIRQFFVWRPRFHTLTVGNIHIPILTRQWDQLWTPDGQGDYRDWLPLPPGDKKDALARIIETYGEKVFLPPGIRWLAEPRRASLLDDRFDYVAVEAGSATVTP